MNEPQYIMLNTLETELGTLTDKSQIETLFQKKISLNKYNDSQFILGVITHTFKDRDLPIELDYIFSDQNTDLHSSTKIKVWGCSNNKKKMHQQLWKGYNHLALLEFENGCPELLQLLRAAQHRSKWNPALIICNTADKEECTKKIIQFCARKLNISEEAFHNQFRTRMNNFQCGFIEEKELWNHVIEELNIPRKHRPNLWEKAFHFAYKPYDEIFELALKRLHTTPEKSLFIDNKIENIKGLLFTTIKDCIQKVNRLADE